MRLSAVFVSCLPLIARVAADTVHLVNVNAGYGGGNQGAIAYYVDDAASYSGTQPASTDICNIPSGSANWIDDLGCTYTTGVTVTTNIQSVGVNTGDWVGTANNGYHGFNCYKDNGRLLFTFGSIGTATSAYYCLS